MQGKKRRDEVPWQKCHCTRLSPLEDRCDNAEQFAYKDNTILSSDCSEHYEIRRNNTYLSNELTSYPGRPSWENCSSSHVLSLLRNLILASRKSSYRVTSFTQCILILVIATASVLTPVHGVCVWEGGGKFSVACGFRQSGLFRIRTLGGIKGYVGAGFTIGDEVAFKDSLKNTEPQSGAYVIPNNVHSQRSLPGPQNGVIGQYSNLQEHAVPIPTGDPASQRQQKAQYLENIQNQMDTDHQQLQGMAQDQQTQRALEQQMQMQGRLNPSSPTSKVKRAGGLQKRASLWNWPTIFGRGKTGKRSKQQGPPGANRRAGPPNRNGKHPRGNQNGPPPRRGERRQHPGNRPQKSEDAFITPMKNPFSHLQENFVGKPQTRRMKEPRNNNKNRGENQRPAYRQGFSGESSGRLPQQSMLPPGGLPSNLPEFKKIPSNKEPFQHRQVAYQEDSNDNYQPPQVQDVNPMMFNEEDPYASPAAPVSPEFFAPMPAGSLERQFNDYETDPDGLKMLKQTENFGQIFHLINPDGSPVNMNFEKKPILPPGVEFSSQQQQDLLDEIASGLPQPGGDEQPISDQLDGPLATAVYDPNIFPDIYFTTTEKHKQLNNLLGMSSELGDNSLLHMNQIKRILGPSSEKTGEETKPRRKLKRRKKMRHQNTIDTSEHDLTGPESATVLPKKRRKARRKKKYRLHTVKPEEMPSSTERMGLGDGGEQSSVEVKAETPGYLTTTPAPTSASVTSERVKTSFTLPSEEVNQLLLTGPSSENKVDTSAPASSTKKTSQETTTMFPMSFSTFGYFDALRNKQGSQDELDYDASGPSGFYKDTYDPRYPPDHEINRSQRNMTKFIRPRKGESSSLAENDYVPNEGSFILHDMTGTRNQSRFSSKFHKDKSPFRLDGEVISEPAPIESVPPPHPFYSNSKMLKDKHGVYVKFDSNEWSAGGKKNKSVNSGHYSPPASSGQYNPSGERSWDSNYPPAGSTEKNHGGFGFFGPTMDSFGLPTPSTAQPSSKEKSNRKLHQNLFGGSSAGLSDELGDWASPNFWGNMQQSDRYSPTADFDAKKDNLKRVSEFGSQGMKEISPGDLSSPTPLPSPTQNTVEDGPENFDYLSPSSPGDRWGKPRKRKGRPTTTVAPTTPTPVTKKTPAAEASSMGSDKWLAVMSNEVDAPHEYYDSNVPPSSISVELERKKQGSGMKKSGVEIKFKSGEERDPSEEEQQQNQNATVAEANSHFNVLSNFPNAYPGVMVHDFESPGGFSMHAPPPPPGFPNVHIPPGIGSDISYFPVNSGPGSGQVQSSEVHPPLAQYSPPRKSSPVFPGKKDFNPSAEDLGPLPPLPPAASPNGGSPSHSANPFKLFEKQNLPGNPAMGFVSPNQEFKQMADQISKFSTLPESFLHRDSSEKFGGPSSHPSNADVNREFNIGQMSAPAGSDVNHIPGYITIPLPNVDQGHDGPHENPVSFVETQGFQAGPPSGLEYHMGDGHGNMNNGQAPGSVLKETWDYRPIEHNEVNESGPQSPEFHHEPRRPVESSEEYRRPPPPHVRDGPPPMFHDKPSHVRDRPPGPPPHVRDGPPGPPPHLRNGPPPHIRDGPPGPPPNLRDGPPPHIRDGPPGPPPHMREEHPPHMRDGPPPHIRDGPPPHIRGGPPPHQRDGPPGPPPHQRNGPPGPPPHIRDGPPAHIRDGPPPHIRDGPPGPPQHIRDGPPGPPPHIRDSPAGPPPHMRDSPPGPPPYHRDRPHIRDGPPSHVRDDEPPHVRGSPAPGLLRPPPPPRDDYERHNSPPERPPPPRDDYDRHNSPSSLPPRQDHPMRPPPPMRDDRPPPHMLDERHRQNEMRPPPHHEDHQRYPPNHHDERPRRPMDHPPRHPPPHLREPERHPLPSREPERNHPPTSHPPRPSHPPPSHPPPTHGPPEDRFRGEHRPDIPPNHHRPPFNDHKPVERPSSYQHFHESHHEHRGEPSKFDSWHEDDHPPTKPHHPPVPHGMPDFIDLQKAPKNKDPKFYKDIPKSQKPHNPFLQKPPPKGPSPTKIPHQNFKPPPPPKSVGTGNFFSNMLNGGPFAKNTPQKHYPPPPRQQLPPPMPPPNSRIPPVNPPPRKPVLLPAMEHLPPDAHGLPPRDHHNNYINNYNDRYEPPSPHQPPRMEDPNHKMNLKPEPFPPLHGLDPAGSRLPFMPFPNSPPGTSFESSMVDLDRDPHAHLLPPKLLPLPPPHHHDAPSLPVRPMQQHIPPKQVPHPIYPSKPNKPDAKMDEKSKLLQAFETLNNANLDVIQSLAADKYGTKYLDKLKTKNHNTPQVPLLTTTPQPPLMSMFAALTSKKPASVSESAKLAELLKMIQSKSHAGQPVVSPSTMGSHSQSSDSLASILSKLGTSQPTTPSTTPPPQRHPEIPTNPGLTSLTSLSNPSHDIKSLQAQIAKAIIAKAHQKPEIAAPLPTSSSHLSVLQQLAQNRQSTIESASPKNYTSSQLATLQKLLALNNLEAKLGSSTTPASTTEDAISKLQALLPAALQAAKLPSSTISRKMLDSSTPNSLSSNLLSPDPTLLALKAIAMSKSQGVHPQPSISFPQQVKPTEPSAQPIAVDLSAILSPSPPVVEASRKRRLTNVRNAPKSFFPANATQGFEDFSGPFMTEFQCDEQSFFPGLYADTELGCRVFHLCAKTEAGYMMKSFRCPKETVFDQEVLRCNWNLFVECPASRNKYHFNKYLSQSFQFLKILGEFSAQKSGG